MQLAVLGVRLLLTIKSITYDSTHVPVAVVVNSPTLTHCQGEGTRPSLIVVTGLYAGH